jgi:PAS domain-containing protein
MRDGMQMARLGDWDFNTISRTAYFSSELCALLNLQGRTERSFDDVLVLWRATDRPAFAAALGDAVRGGHRMDFVGRLVGPTGPERWLRVVGEPVFERGECVALRGAAEDVSEQRMALARLGDGLQ